jgi:RNA polymerase subunit RPABC4/transcription elongation factor Spt4
MPTFKHPCPYCGKFIDRAVAACPFCGVAEPFSPKRCSNCRRIVEDPAWIVCPGCGQSLLGPVIENAVPGSSAGAATSTAGASAPAQTAPAPVVPPPPPAAAAPAQAAPAMTGGVCSGCRAPLPAGARFCTVCGTMAG